MDAALVAAVRRGDRSGARGDRAARARSAPPNRSAPRAVAQEQADRVAICEEIWRSSGAGAADRIAELKVRWDSLPPMPSEYAASLTRRFQDACRAVRGPRAAPDAGGGRGGPARDAGDRARAARRVRAAARGNHRALARPAARRRRAPRARVGQSGCGRAARARRRAARGAGARSRSQARAKQEQDNLRRLQQLCRQVETLAAAEQITLKAGDRALRDIRAALDERAPLPSKKDRQEIQARLEKARAALGPRVQELRDADEWQRWANLQVQEELCREMDALKAEAEPRRRRPPHARAAGALEAGGARAAGAGRGDVAPVQGGAGRGVQPHRRALRRAERGARREPGAEAGALRARRGAGRRRRDWVRTAIEIQALQAEWKTIGPVTRGHEKAIWERFRGACDRFFTRRQEDLKQRKERLGRQPRAEGSALREGRGAGRFHRLGRDRGR